jgi:exopolyphosphatase/guanosine-5'-triphosphate,3'-diphosphate pyrophosphatase
MSAVATSVFRKAHNGQAIISSWQKKLKIKKMRVISQEEEAELGMKSVLTQLPKEMRDLSLFMVWDIGGGSMQMLGYDQKKQKHLYSGDLASVSFKNMVMEALQLKNMETEKTPNPIGDKKESAHKLAKSYASIHVPQKIKDLIKDKLMIGIGGVHHFSIRNQIGTKNDFYTLAEVKAAALIQSTKKDEELAGDYRSTDVTNLFLVSGFMEALGIDKVQVKSASLLEGLLFQ